MTVRAKRKKIGSRINDAFARCDRHDVMNFDEIVGVLDSVGGVEIEAAS
jgi:hypothetical protein